MGKLAMEFIEDIGASGAAGEDQSQRGFGGRSRGREEGADDLRLDAGEAAAVPIGLDESLDEIVFQRANGVELLAVILREGFEGGGIFAGDDEGASLDAVFQGIEAGRGLPLFRAGASGSLRIQAVGVDLSWGCHSSTG